MKPVTWIAATALVLFSAGSFAARPTSIVFDSTARTPDGEFYGRYNVQCNDGRTVTLTAWDGRRKWCLGEGNSCEKQQIRAAKSACSSPEPAAPEPPAHALAYSR